MKKITLSLSKFQKYGFTFDIIDVSETWKDLHIISIQLFFKTGIAILYELQDT